MKEEQNSPIGDFKEKALNMKQLKKLWVSGKVNEGQPQGWGPVATPLNLPLGCVAEPLRSWICSRQKDMNLEPQ